LACWKLSCLAHRVLATRTRPSKEVSAGPQQAEKASSPVARLRRTSNYPAIPLVADDASSTRAQSYSQRPLAPCPALPATWLAVADSWVAVPAGKI